MATIPKPQLTTAPKKPAAPPPDKWIEIFHSKPSMKHCYLLEKLPNGEFTEPGSGNELVDASHVREGFRVMRFPARRIEFVLTNGTNRHWEDNNGANYVIDSIPGRYVIEHGIRRVGEANAAECIQAAMRPNDEYIQVEFRADLWDKCFCSFQADKDPWTPAPGVAMTTLDKKDVQGRFFQFEVKAQRVACAFNDGGEIWENNLRRNYHIAHPGKYAVADGKVHYISPADKDLKKPMADSTPLPVIVEPTASVSPRQVAEVAH